MSQQLEAAINCLAAAGDFREDENYAAAIEALDAAINHLIGAVQLLEAKER